MSWNLCLTTNGVKCRGKILPFFLLVWLTFATVSVICVSAILRPMQDLAPIANGKEANGLDTPL